MTTASLTVNPIGLIHTPYSDRCRAPRQPDLAETDCQATIVLNPRHNFEQALEDLAGFDMIWIISWLDRNKNWNPKVFPPRGPRKKRGVFATRSPHRPNPIGISIARLLGIKARTLSLGATDLLDGTPVLDIKPYLPYADAFPHARAGWLDELAAIEAQPNLNSQQFEVNWSALALEQARWLTQKLGRDLAAETNQILAADPSPHPYRRIARWNRTHSILAIESWRIKFSIHETRVEIERIVSGYSITSRERAIPSDPRLDEQDAHAEFNNRWPQTPVCPRL